MDDAKISRGRLILVCGASGSGKSSLAEALGEAIGCANILHQDNYFLKPFLSYKERVDDSFEGPAHVDWPRLRRDVREALEKSDKSIVEGHLVAADEESAYAAARCDQWLRQCDNASLVVLLRCPPELCKTRRLQRRPREVAEAQELSDYIDRFVLPAFLKYGQPALDALEESCRESSTSVLTFDAAITTVAEQLEILRLAMGDVT
ncbi:unnamed protein product [Cladocopium goreaui]|uniref:Phosphoribulokinase/uridine kinase domain-containing protein n=1 Tax=Cladocopium goreaui TaxID=2562237 RepID=A0A9P1GLH9_9DINO|nr:unnamed protein product [Cladocopium goreaui]